MDKIKVKTIGFDNPPKDQTEVLLFDGSTALYSAVYTVDGLFTDGREIYPFGYLRYLPLSQLEGVSE